MRRAATIAVFCVGILLGAVRASHETDWLQQDTDQRLAAVMQVVGAEAILHTRIWEERSIKPIKAIVANWPSDQLRFTLWDRQGVYWHWGDLEGNGYGVLKPVMGRAGPVGAVSLELDVVGSMVVVHVIVLFWLTLCTIGYILLERRRQSEEWRLKHAELSIIAQEAETRRLAQELHDTIGQDLSVLSMLADGDDPEATSDASRRAIVDLRRIVADLHPIELDAGSWMLRSRRSAFGFRRPREYRLNVRSTTSVLCRWPRRLPCCGSLRRL